jgi:predicted enzyme involved in methoxymalonyl-ACP biosynthesis
MQRKLADKMRVAADAALYLDQTTIKGKKLQQAVDASMLSGLIGSLGTTSAVTGITLFVYKTMYEGIYNTYFSKFTAFDNLTRKIH